MYSPKIDERYIPVLYRLRKELKIPMTKLVNSMIADGVKKIEKKSKQSSKKLMEPGAMSGTQVKS